MFGSPLEAMGLFVLASATMGRFTQWHSGFAAGADVMAGCRKLRVNGIDAGQQVRSSGLTAQIRGGN
jgi:hypothetical protein